MKKETIYQFYQHYKLYIFPTVVALSSLFLILFALYPQTAKLIENQRVAGDLVNRSKFLSTKVAALESLDAGDLSQKVGIALNTFPAEKDYGNIFGLLQVLAAQSGFTISSISVGNGTGVVGSASSFEIKLEVKGSRNLFKVFITSLENSPRIMKIGSIDIASAQSSETLDASLAVEVLYSLAPQTFGTIDSPLPSLNQKEEELLAVLSRVNLPASSSATLPSQRGKANPFE